MAGILDIFRGRNQAAGAGNLGGMVRMGGSHYQTGNWNFARTANSVYGNPTGYRCVEAIANNLSRPTWQVYKQGTKEVIDGHPLLDVLNHPEPMVSGTQMQRAIARDKLLTGKSLLAKTRGADAMSVNGPVTGLRRIPIQRVSVLGDADDQLIGFIYSDRQGRRVGLLPEEVVYLRYPHPDRTYDGMAPAVVAGLAAETDGAAARFNFDLLSNDGALPGYLSVEGLTPDEFREWKAAWEMGEVPGKTRFIGAKGTYTRVGQTNQELTYTDLRDASQLDIMKAFGCPPVVVFEVSHETYANAEAELGAFWEQTLLPDLVLTSDEMTAQLGAEFGVDIGFGLDEIAELGEATDAVVERFAKLIELKAASPYELREELGLDPDGYAEGPQSDPVAPPIPPPANPPVLLPRPQDANAAPKAAGAEGTKGIQDPTPASQADPRWRKFDQRVTLFEHRAKRKLMTYFGRQGRVIEARMLAQRGKSIRKAYDGELVDGSRWNPELTQDLADLLTDTVDSFGTNQLAELGVGRLFDARAENVRAWIEGRSSGISPKINATTEDELRTLLADLEAEGLGIDEIARQVRGYFGEDGRAAIRAETFARTEIIGASNFGALEGARQSGVVDGKQWLSTNDGRTDEECAALDGLGMVPLDSDFDGYDQPPAHPNCRCTLLFNTTADSQTADQTGDYSQVEATQ